MATEQAYYALAAYDRFSRKANRLYDMSDVVPMEDADVQGVIDLIAAIGPVGEDSYNAIAPEEAIRAATWNPACALGVENEVGAIADGMQADFVVCGENWARQAVYLAGQAL